MSNPSTTHRTPWNHAPPPVSAANTVTANSVPIGNFQHNNRSGWNDMSFSGFSQSQFDYHDENPHGCGFHYADRRYLPNQTFGPTTSTVAPLHADSRYLPHQMPGPTIPTVSPLHADSRYLPHQTPGPTIPSVAPLHADTDSRYLPHQTPGPTIPTAAPLQRSRTVVFCEICDVRLPSEKNMEWHTNGKRHQRMLKLSNGYESRQMSNSQVNRLVQPKTVLKLEKSQCPVENVSSEATISKHKYQKKDIGLASEVPAEGSKRKLGDNTRVDTDTVAPLHADTDSRYIPHQTPGPTIPTAAPLQQSRTVAFCEICNVRVGSKKNMEGHTNGKRHQRMLKLSNGYESRQMPNSQMNSLVQPKAVPKLKKNRCPVENVSSEATISKHKYWKKDIGLTSEVPAEGSKRKLGDNTRAKDRGFKRKIGESTRGKYMKTNNGIRRPMKDIGLTSEVPAEGSERKLGDNTRAKDCGFKCKIGESTGGKHMKMNKWIRRPIKDIGLTSEVPAEGSERKLGDYTRAKDCGFKRKIRESAGGKYTTMINGIRRPMKSSKPEVTALSNSVESLVQIPTLTPPPGPVASPIMAPTPVVGSSFQLQFQHVPASQNQVPKGKEHHEIENPTMETNDQPQSTPMELHAPAGSYISTRTEDMSCDFAATAITPPQGPMTSQVFTPPPAVGSSFEPKNQLVLETDVSEGKDHNDIQNHSLDSNDQPQSISVELPMTSQVFTPLLAVGSSSEPKNQHALETEVSEGKGHNEIQNHSLDPNIQPQSISVELPMTYQVFTPLPAVGSSFEPKNQHVLETEVSEGKDHNEIQNHSLVSNDQPQSISVELHAPSGSSINTQTEDVNYDSAAITTAPQAYAPPLAVGSNFEPIEHVLSEIELQASEAITYCESQSPSEETNIQLLPSVLMEFDAPSEVIGKIQTTGRSSKAEEKMNDPATESGITQLLQVFVCLTCGDEGFPETLVFCKKCQVYALHRYCLDGPVIFVDEVIWFCEDCDAKAVDTASQDQCCLLPSERNDSANSAEDASQDRIELTSCTVRAFHKQQQQNIYEEKIVESSSHDQCCLLPSERSDSANSADASQDSIELTNCTERVFHKQQQQNIYEEKVVESSSHDQCCLLPSERSDSANSEDASQARTELTDCIKRVNGNKQQQQNIAAENEVLLTDCHSSSHQVQSQCRNNSEEEKKFKKDSQPVQNGEANSGMGSVTVVDPQPIADPIWRGSLHSCNQSFGAITGLLAHLSSLACAKVLEEMRLFPEVLRADLLQRSAVWPESFMKCGPNNQSIALYFFPENERVERDFDELVDDLVSQDLAIRAVVENAELLDFKQSTTCGGSLEKKQTSPKTNDVVCGEDTSVDKAASSVRDQINDTQAGRGSCFPSIVMVPSSIVIGTILLKILVNNKFLPVSFSKFSLTASS